ncbi:hemicentin-1 [Nilaparvata lugens]|uniref:hemicentin-1 n=1 Tax=Nilaparvata lugens TaxID=108931 RepID=UPI00193CB446|nr:hemicentin-1 [Nilaparvata lugens]
MENDGNQCIASLCRLLGVILSLCVNISYSGDDDMLSKHNVSGLMPQFGSGSDTENYLQELSGFWSYNDTTDLSKYEDFDHSRFLDRPSDRLEEVAAMTPHTPVRPTNLRRTTSSTTEAGPTTRSPNMPRFDRTVTTNVTAQLGGTAFLNCRVFKLGERTVSWVRRRDWHILTSGVLTYTNDERFQAVHADNTEDWNLQIKYVQKRDNGTYECQVATGSGTISHYFTLHVVVPNAYILGNGEYHIGEGSTISLVCIIENSPQPPQYVFWYHNERMVNFDPHSRGSVTVTSEEGSTQSRLLVNRAIPSDSGNYTCRASNTQQDTIYVFVSKGKSKFVYPNTIILCFL